MATITEDYVSFETAKLLKEKGFNETCNRVYQGPNLKYTTLPISPLMSLGELGGFHPKQLYVNNNELGDIVYTAPTLQMAMKWLREVYGLHIEPHIQTYKNYNGNIYNLDGELLLGFTGESPEQACEAAIKYCLEYLI